MSTIDISDNEAIYSAVLAVADKILRWREELHRAYGTGTHIIGYTIVSKCDQNFNFNTTGVGKDLYDAERIKGDIMTRLAAWLEHARTTDADYLHIDVYKNAFTVTTMIKVN